MESPINVQEETLKESISLVNAELAGLIPQIIIEDKLRSDLSDEQVVDQYLNEQST